MYKQQYEDFKYVMQDTYQLYLGAKYTFAEVCENEDVPFKFRLIVERYVCDEADPETSLESHFYYLTEKSFLFRLYKQIKLKVKVNILEEKKNLLGQTKKQYTTSTLTIGELVNLSPAEKERLGVVIQEVSCSKMALMTF